MNKKDPVLDGMVDELHSALLKVGADTKNPPPGGPPPEAAFREYRLRGGAAYTDPGKFAAALVEGVTKK